MARTVGAALRPVDGNAPGAQQLAEAGHCAHMPASPSSSAATATAAPGSRTPDRDASYVPAATQDEVAEQVATDHLKHLNLSPSVSNGLPSADSPAFTVHADSVRSPARDANDPTAGVHVDEFLTMRVPSPLNDSLRLAALLAVT